MNSGTKNQRGKGILTCSARTHPPVSNSHSSLKQNTESRRHRRHRPRTHRRTLRRPHQLGPGLPHISVAERPEESLAGADLLQSRRPLERLADGDGLAGRAVPEVVAMQDRGDLEAAFARRVREGIVSEEVETGVGEGVEGEGVVF